MFELPISERTRCSSSSIRAYLEQTIVDKRDYLAVLRAVITHLHGCGSVHLATEHVHEEFHGETVWEGDVEVFDLMQHPKAKRAYCWAHSEGNQSTRYVTVLELPPVTDARTAVQASITANAGQSQN